MITSDDYGLEALRRGEQQHRLLLETLPHGVQRNDCEGVITYSNRAHHALLGLRPGELIGKRIWDFLASEEDKQDLRRYFKSLVDEQPSPVPYLAKNLRSDGSEVYLQVEWTYEHDDDGKLRGFISVITDVTDHRRDEELLRRRNQGLAELLAVSQGFVETVDADRILQRAVDGVTKLVGLDTAAVYLVTGEYLELRATTPHLPEDFPEQLRLATLADHPHAKRAIDSCEPVLVPDMKSVTLTPAEQSIAEARLLRTILFLPMVTDARAIGVFIVGSRHEPRAIPSAEVDLSRTLANLAALTVRNAQLFERGRKHAAQLERSLLERLSADAERKRLQKQLVQAQKMESVGRLAGGVAHDFNNMLAVILGHAGLALEDLRETDPLYEHLTQILHAAERSSSLTRQLLAFARKQTINPRLLNLNDVVSDMLKMLQRLMGEDITIAWSPGVDLGLVHMDPAQIDQILANLCVNARDALFTNGTVTISTANVVLDERSIAPHSDARPGDYVMIAVNDNGRGMDRATREKIFEPFFTTKEAGKGTGLGLSTVYGIVKQNSGFIDVETAPGGGTTMKIYFPEGHAETATPKASAERSAPEGGHETILLVEDEAVLLALVQEMLESLGYRVLAAQGPKLALALASEATGPIHLLVTDVVMPDMNGSELAEKLSSVLPDLKTLFVSGYTANVIAHRGVLAGGIMLLPKPFSKQQLAAKVREALDSSQQD